MELEHGFVLGDWRVEPSLNRISKGRRHKTLEPQAMDVLCLLAQHAGQVVSTDEIVRIAWAGRPVSDNPVYKVINKLRRALGDNSRAPVYLETLTKRGYRLIAQVEPLPLATALAPEQSSEPNADAAPQTIHTPARPPAKRNITTLGAAAIGAVVLLLSLFWLMPESKTPQPKIQPLLTISGSSSQANVASDGRIAFVNDSTGINQLWLLPEPNARPAQLTFSDTPSDTPHWSPDGARLLFNRGRDLWQLTPGEPERLFISNAQNGAFASSGKQLVFERGEEVWLANALGSDQRRVTAIDDRNQFFAAKRPSFSPDGTRLVYFQAVEGPLGDIWSVDIQSGQLFQLTADRTHAGGPVYSTDGQSVIFHSARSGPMMLWRVPSDGGEATPLLSSAGDDTDPALSPDGQSLVYASARERWSLVRSDPTTGRIEVLYDSRTPILAPELSKDGQQLAFFAINAQRQTRVSILNLNNRDIRELNNQPDAASIMPKWSNDGDWIYYYQAGQNHQWRRFSVDGTSDELIFEEWNFNEEHDTTIHPSGDRAIFARLSGNEVVATAIKDLHTGSEAPFPTRVTWVDWSTNGESLVATEFSGRPLPVGPVVLCKASTRDDWPCVQVAERGQHPVWAPDEQSVYFAQPLDDKRMNIWRYEIAEGSLSLVKELAPLAVDIGPFFDVDERGHVLWVRHEEGRSELWNLMGWRE